LNGQLHVENQFGDIDVRVGREREVSVSAKLELRQFGDANIPFGSEKDDSLVAIIKDADNSDTRFNHSPVSIKTTPNLLSISVQRPAADPRYVLN